ncbi:Pycsar system effector family protein [Actinoplanes sp. CA-131856]
MNFIRGRQSRPSIVPPSGASPEDAWRALFLMVEWIRHADGKATAALASAGVTGSLLYTLVNTADRRGTALAISAAACALAIIAAATAAGMALLPRLASRPEPTGLIYYRAISERFGTGADAYATAYSALAADQPALFAALTRQVWATASVATRKYRAINVSIAALLPALLLLAVTAVLSLLGR